MTLSLAMIVKDAGDKLDRALASVSGVCNQLVVVDTGSADDTVERAEKAGAEVHHYKWRNDFSAARNYSLSKCTGDWILIVDHDEWLEDDAGDAVLEVCTLKDASGAYCFQRNITKGGYGMKGEWKLPQIRMFRNLPGNRYKNAVHNFPVIEGKIIPTDIGIWHDGYDLTEEEWRAKVEHRLPMILKEQKRDPKNPKWSGHLFDMYRAAKMDTEALNAARDHLRLSDPVEHRDIYIMALCKLGRQLLVTGDPKEGIDYLVRAIEAEPFYADPHLLVGVGLFRLGHWEQAREQFKTYLTVLESRPEDRFSKIAEGLADLDYYAHWRMATCALQLGDQKASVDHLLDSVRCRPDFQPARDALGRLQEMVAA